MSFFQTDRLSAADAIVRAQHIAFAPMVFQATRALRSLGILALVDAAPGITQAEIEQRSRLSTYGVRVLLEAGLGIGLLTLSDGHYHLTKVGWFMLHDRMTIANMDFANDVCYEGMASLDRSIATGTPTGLKVFGDWQTIYHGLAHLPSNATRSWYAFDHYYSDDAYPTVLPLLRGYGSRSILDIGGNTGRFALKCLRLDPQVRMGIVDLPPMTASAAAAIAAEGFSDRVTFHPTDLLDPAQDLPRGYDAIWMSQFLDCFSEREIVAILCKVRDTLEDGSRVFIMEPFWDRQRREVSAFCLQMTSLYFTNMANGNSQLYHSEVFLGLVQESGLAVVDQVDHIGVCQTLLVCQRR